MPSQPTILVKKADGSQVRLTMDEFRRYQEERGKSEEIKKLGNLETKKLGNLETEALATSAPVKEIWVDEAIARGTGNVERGKRSAGLKTRKEWTKEDHKSLLEETGEEVKKKPAAASLPSTRDDVCAQVARELKFPISDELRSRLQSLIISRVKDIRSDEQVKEYALRQTATGGLGLSAAQADELLGAVRKVLRLPAATMLEEKRKMKASNKSIIKPISDSAGQLSNKPMTQPANNAAAKETGANKPIINDIVPSAKQTIGPVEELGTMTLVNFRRLAADPSVAGKILQEKFKELETESYLLYLDAIKAWRQSPLYRQYLAAMVEAINRQQKISALLAGNDREQLKENEFMALVEVNGELSS